MALPLIELSGTPFEQGVQHGRALKNRIIHNLELYFERFKTEVFLERPEVLRRAELYAAAIAADNPAYYETMQGVAEGAALPFGDIAALNVRYEILYYEFGVGENARAQIKGSDGCTSFALMPERTSNAHLLMGQSWDWIPGIKGALLKTREEAGLKVLAFTEAGIVGGKIGLNSSGLGLCINGLASLVDDWTTLAKPFHVRCFEILRQTSLEAARAVVTETSRPGSANFLLAQAPDAVLNLETAPDVFSETLADEGARVHTNHFENPAALALSELENEFWQYSCGRQRRLQTLLASKARLSISDLKSFLRDHDGRPNSVCRHEDPDFGPEEHYISVVSVLMDLNTQTLWLSDGPPCEHPFDEYGL